MSKYDNYVFDLYGTLVDIKTNENKPNLWKQIARMYGYYGAAYTPKELKKAYQSEVQHQKDILTVISDVQYVEIELKDVFQELFLMKNVHPTEEMILEIAHAFRSISTDYVQLFDGTIEMLEALKNANKHIYLLSNAQTCFTLPEMKYLGIIDYFDQIYISSDCGCKKPDIQFFQKLIDTERLDARKTIMVGNEYESDITGATSAGMDTLYVVSKQTPKNDVCKSATYQLKEMDMQKMKNILLKGDVR